MKAATRNNTLKHALTVDVEDYFQVWALSSQIDRNSWESRPCRIERNVDAILQLFAQHQAQATFFTLGWVAERYPQVIRKIVAAGHELASHGYAHERLSDLTPAQMRDDLLRAKSLLEDIGGQPIRGYRAPSFSLGKHNLWALDVITDTGHHYSSSIYPVKHDHYGIPDAPRFAFRHANGLLEIPVTTTRVLGRNLPAGGGGYFRLLPYAASRWMIERVQERDGQSSMFYFHPWEIDPDQPQIDGISWKSRFRHYNNLERMQGKLTRLLRDFRWDRADAVFAEQLKG